MALGLLAAVPAGAATVLHGPAQVVDGDTIRVETPGGLALVRLHGIDAAERDQTCRDAEGREHACGRGAAAALDRLIAGREVACEAVDIDRYDRIVARCHAGGIDLGGAMVAQGEAWAFAAYSSDYVAAERDARAAARGLWAGQAQHPAQWRADRRAEAQARRALAEAEPTSPDCRIKGNISERGRIYHVPGSRSYDRTGVDIASGERWFCTEEQALAAGWRAPQG